MGPLVASFIPMLESVAAGGGEWRGGARHSGSPVIII